MKLRILLSPFIFAYYMALLLGGTLFAFPFGFITIGGMAVFILSPVIFLVEKSGVEINLDYDLFFTHENKLISLLGNSALMMTIHVWLPFYGTYVYIHKAEILLK